jgi:hypothetical protein
MQSIDVGGVIAFLFLKVPSQFPHQPKYGGGINDSFSVGLASGILLIDQFRARWQL